MFFGFEAILWLANMLGCSLNTYYGLFIIRIVGAKKIGLQKSTTPPQYQKSQLSNYPGRNATAPRDNLAALTDDRNIAAKKIGRLRVAGFAHQRVFGTPF